jgi:hypothetical protein
VHLLLRFVKYEGTRLEKKFKPSYSLKTSLSIVSFRGEQFANDKICNCSSNTFGKFCEYEFLTMNTFEQTIQYQFDLKKKYQNGSQIWGNITCYTTLTNCYFGLRCLTWQNICDGKYYSEFVFNDKMIQMIDNDL